MNKIQLPNIFICGPSGSGKTSSFRNLNPETTAIININRKALPFRSANRFKYHKQVSEYGEVTQELLMGFGTNPAIEVIAIDDFTSVDESILATSRKTEKGYSIYGKHNQEVASLIKTSLMLSETRGTLDKPLPAKWIIWTGIDDLVNIAQPDGTNKSQRRIKVEGKELQGWIETKFTVVLFTEVIASKVAGQMGKFEYKFMTNGDGITSAKTPVDLFTDRYVDNDVNMVIQNLKKYYEIN